jgi:hypothetical protein
MKYLASLSLFLCLLPVPQLSAQVGNEAKKPDAVKAPQAEVKKGETGAGGKGEGEESDPAFKLVPAPDGRAYFPKGRAGWYTRHLSVMKEPSLQPKEKEPGEWTLRFTWLRSFHKPIAVRVWKEGNDVRMRAVRLNGKGGYDPGKIDKDIARKLTTDEWKALQPLTETKELWMPLTGEEEALDGMDGAQWIFERRMGKTYSLSDYWSPKYAGSVKAEDLKRVGIDPAKIRDFTNIIKLGMMLVKMAELTPPVDDIY